jgi:carboxypeptidase Taq
LTYDLHIMLRVELEAALMDGGLSLKDLPAAWNDGMGRLLGLTPPDDRTGVLQDIHWSSGMIGSFCTYTVGNVMAAQLFEAARADDAVAAGLGAGDYAPLADWLRDRVWRFGRSRSRQQLVEAASGGPLAPNAYLDHLRQRYGAGR